MWRKAMNYLGLGPDDEYYDDEPVQPERAQRSGRSSYGPDESTVTVRPVSSRPTSTRESGSNVREMPQRDPRHSSDHEVSTVVTRPRQGSAVRTVAATAAPAKPTTVTPMAFNDAQEVGDRFREGQPVIINLESVDRELSRRIIDFTSGLCYALAGRMERVANGVYLLTPSAVDLADEERRRHSEFDD
jgi:cell division inhibitor SepF